MENILNSNKVNTALDNPIIDIQISAPNAGANNTIDLLYCFDSDQEVDSNYNYIYNNLPNEAGKLSIKLPFAGTILLNPQYEIIKVDTLSLYFALNINNGDTVQYEKEDYSQDRFTFQIQNSQIFDPSGSSTNTSVSWNLNENWNSEVNIDINTETICNIIARISLIVRKRNDDGTTAEPFRLPVFLTSEYDGISTDDSIKVSPCVKITVRDYSIISDPILQSVFTGSLNEARCYSSSGVASLSNGQQAFLVAGGMNRKSITFTTGNNTIDALTIESEAELINLGANNTLSSDKYRSTGQVIKDSAGVSYFVVAGGYGSASYSNELEVFRADSNASLTKIEGQTAVLPSSVDHAASTVITDGEAEYLVIAGGFSNSNAVSVYSIDLNGMLSRVDDGSVALSNFVYGATAGMIINGNERYLLVAGGMQAAQASNVDIYEISLGGVLSHTSTLQLQSARGDLAGVTIEDEIGKQYFVVAGGRTNNSSNVSNEIDVFGFNDAGNIARVDGQPSLNEARFDIAKGVIDKQYFIAAGGYINGTECSDTIDLFSIDLNGILHQKNNVNDISLKTKTASASSGVISDSDGKKYFIIAGGNCVTSTTDDVEIFEFQNSTLKSISSSNLSRARGYSSSGVVTSESSALFIVAGGSYTKTVETNPTCSADIDMFLLEGGIANLNIEAVLNSGKYRTTGQVIKDSAGVSYFVVAGGYGSARTSNELEVFRVESNGNLTKVENQTIVLPQAADHMSSTVITDGKQEYFVIAGGFNNHSIDDITTYSIKNGQLLQIEAQSLPVSICGAAIGMLTNVDKKRYLIVAGGMSVNVSIYEIELGGKLTLRNTLSLKSARGDLAGKTIKDISGKEYFVVAGGRSNYTYTPMFNDIDVFGFDDVGQIIRIENQPTLSEAKFDISAEVLNELYFIVAGGYIDNSSKVSDVIEMFSIGTDGILKKELPASLSIPTASAVSGIISDKEGKQHFIIAGGSSLTETTDAVEVFELITEK